MHDRFQQIVLVGFVAVVVVALWWFADDQSDLQPEAREVQSRRVEPERKPQPLQPTPVVPKPDQRDVRAQVLAKVEAAQSEPIEFLAPDAASGLPPKTCRIVYPERMRESPKVAHLFDGQTSRLVTLPNKNLSEVIELPGGELMIAMTADEISDRHAVSPDAPKMIIPESVQDFYIVITPDPNNHEFPVQMHLINSGEDSLKFGQTIWFNFTDHKIIAELGSSVTSMPPMGVVVAGAPRSGNGHYPAEISYQVKGVGPAAPVTAQQWWHDAGSKHLGFVVDSGGRLPKLYLFRDFRTDARKVPASEDSGGAP